MKLLSVAKKFVEMDSTMVSINAMMGTLLMEMDAILDAKLNQDLTVLLAINSLQVFVLTVEILQLEYLWLMLRTHFTYNSMKKLYSKIH